MAECFFCFGEEQVVLFIAATKRGEQVDSMSFVHVEQVLFGIAARGVGPRSNL